MKSADIVIITVIEAERDAALAAFGFSDANRFEDDYGTVYYPGKIQSEILKQELTVAIACIGWAGNTTAASLTMALIANLRPRVVILMGIAAGIRGKSKIGDVIIGDRVIAYEHAALRLVRNVWLFLIERFQSSEEPRPEMSRMSHRMHQNAIAYKCKITLAEFVAKMKIAKPHGLPEDISDPISIRCSTIASGEKLLRDPSRLKKLRRDMHGKIEVGEMEAAGFVEACRIGEKDWIIFRGISDFGDELKSDDFHLYASATAAMAAFDFVTSALTLSPTRDLSNASSTFALVMDGGNVFVPDAADLKGKTGIQLDVRIWNTGEPSSVAEWILHVIPNGGSPVLAQLTKIPATLKLSGVHNNAEVKASDSLDSKTRFNSVTLTQVEGKLLFYVDLNKDVVLNGSTELRLTVIDLYGKATVVSKKMSDWMKR